MSTVGKLATYLHIAASKGRDQTACLFPPHQNRGGTLIVFRPGFHLLSNYCFTLSMTSSVTSRSMYSPSGMSSLPVSSVMPGTR